MHEKVIQPTTEILVLVEHFNKILPLDDNEIEIIGELFTQKKVKRRQFIHQELLAILLSVHLFFFTLIT